MTICPACQGIIGPHKSTDGYKCRCPHNIKWPAKETKAMTTATTHLRMDSIKFHARWGTSGDDGYVVHASDAEELERDLTTRIAELESRVKQLEGVVRGADEAFAKLFWTTDDGIRTRDGEPEDCDADAFTLSRWKACRAALSPSPPAVENEGIPLPVATIDLRTGDVVDDAPVEVERWAKEKAAHKAGKRIENRPWGTPDSAWLESYLPSWHEDLEYRIHPDDDAPPVQTEEKPATVPLAVAEGQWQDIETAPKDGTEILLGYPGGVEPGWWQESVWLRGWCCGGHRSDAYGPDKEPTHWMPIPPAPATPPHRP